MSLLGDRTDVVFQIAGDHIGHFVLVPSLNMWVYGNNLGKADLNYNLRPTDEFNVELKKHNGHLHVSFEAI